LTTGTKLRSEHATTPHETLAQLTPQPKNYVKINPNALVANDIDVVALFKQVGERVGPKQQLEIQALTKV